MFNHVPPWQTAKIGENVRPRTSSGWWLTYPAEKYESQWEGLSHIWWKIKHVWNHQPVMKTFQNIPKFHGLWVPPAAPPCCRWRTTWSKGGGLWWCHPGDALLNGGPHGGPHQTWEINMSSVTAYEGWIGFENGGGNYPWVSPIPADSRAYVCCRIAMPKFWDKPNAWMKMPKHI